VCLPALMNMLTCLQLHEESVEPGMPRKSTTLFWRALSTTLHHSPPRSTTLHHAPTRLRKEQNAKEAKGHENIYLDIVFCCSDKHDHLAHAVSCAFPSVFMCVLHVFPFVAKISVAG
jgi:hypothetical protein